MKNILFAIALSSTLITAVASAQNNRPETVGFKIEEVEGTPFQALGLKKGDILVSINGRPFTPTKETLAFLESLRTKNKFTIEFERDGKRQTTDVDVK
jgi:type II secretory pathway component PulC